MKNIIEVNNLTKKYPCFTLSQASFTVPEGCITGFVGANGAGKTTTLRAILGLLQPGGGEIAFCIYAKHYDQRDDIKHRGKPYIVLVQLPYKPDEPYQLYEQTEYGK